MIGSLVASKILRLTAAAALCAMVPAAARAACAPTATPPALAAALDGVCASKYLTCDRGGPEFEKACRDCQKLRQRKLQIDQANRACEAQTVPAADSKAIDDALTAADSVKIIQSPAGVRP